MGFFRTWCFSNGTQLLLTSYKSVHSDLSALSLSKKGKKIATGRGKRRKKEYKKPEKINTGKKIRG